MLLQPALETFPDDKDRGCTMDHHLHVSLKAEEIHILVMLRMNHEFMEYMRASYPDTPLSEFKSADTYVRARGGVETLDDDEDDQ